MKLKKAMKEAAKEMEEEITGYRFHLSEDKKKILAYVGIALFVTLPFTLSVISSFAYLIIIGTDLLNITTWTPFSIAVPWIFAGFLIMLPWMKYWFKVIDKMTSV